MVVNQEVEDFAKSSQKAKENWRKFKRTGSKRAQRKADFYYGKVDGYSLIFKNPATSVDVKQTTIENSFNPTKVNGVNNPNTSVKIKKTINKQKTNKKKK